MVAPRRSLTPDAYSMISWGGAARSDSTFGSLNCMLQCIWHGERYSVMITCRQKSCPMQIDETSSPGLGLWPQPVDVE